MIALLTLLAAPSLADEVDAVEPDLPEEVDAGPDRSAPPEVGPPTWLDLDEPEVITLHDGLDAWMVDVPGLRKVALRLVLHRGYVELSGGPDPDTMAMAYLLDTGTADRSPAELEAYAARHDIEVSSYLRAHHGVVGLEVPVDDVDRGLDLFAEVLLTPSWARSELRVWKQDEELQLLVNGPATPGAAAGSALTFAWFPADIPYGQRPDLKAVRRVKRKGLRDLHDRWLLSAPATVVVVGDRAQLGDDFLDRVHKALGQVGRPGDIPEPLTVPPAPPRVLAVSFPGQAQARIALRLPAPTERHPDRVAYDAAAWALGGHFGSRLNANLREDKGFTYGTSASYAVGRTSAWLGVGLEVAVENLAEAVTEVQAELARLRDEGVRDEELEWYVRAEAFSWSDVRRTAGSTMGFYAGRLLDEERVADARARQQAMTELAPADVQAVLGTWLAADAPRVWVVTGDRDRIEEELATLGWEAEWVEPQAAILGTF